MSSNAADSKLYLFAFVNFQPGRYEDWQKAYDELAVYVWGQEPTTESYYFGIPFDDANDLPNASLMFAFEVYTDRESLYGAHFNSPAMKKFLGSAFPVMTTGFDLQHYTRVGGFLDAAPPPADGSATFAAAGLIHDTKIVAKSPAARDVLVKRLAELGRAIEADRDDGVLTWAAFESQDNPLDARILARYRDRASLDRLARRPEVAAFWAASKENEIDRIEPRGYVENGKGWLHR